MLSVLKYPVISHRGCSCRVDIGSSDISYQRMRAAIHFLNYDPEQHEDLSQSPWEAILQGTGLRDVLLKAFIPEDQDTPKMVAEPNAHLSAAREPGFFFENQMIHSWAKRYQSSDPVVIDGDPVLELNTPQIQAIANMIGQRICLIQGVGPYSPGASSHTGVLLMSGHIVFSHLGPGRLGL
jgi:hypothetical protein